MSKISYRYISNIDFGSLSKYTKEKLTNKEIGGVITLAIRVNSAKQVTFGYSFCSPMELRSGKFDKYVGKEIAYNRLMKNETKYMFSLPPYSDITRDVLTLSCLEKLLENPPCKIPSYIENLIREKLQKLAKVQKP